MVKFSLKSSSSKGSSSKSSSSKGSSSKGSSSKSSSSKGSSSKSSSSKSSSSKSSSSKGSSSKGSSSKGSSSKGSSSKSSENKMKSVSHTIKRTKYGDSECKEKVWNKGSKVKGKDSALYRRDKAGNILYKPSYGKLTPMGWDLDHKKPKSRGGSDDMSNIQILQSEYNREKGNSLVKAGAK
jgi:5-methylcytosine-specific restriction endonuclease McrA